MSASSTATRTRPAERSSAITLATVNPPTEQQLSAARVTVHRFASDAADEALLLDALGLHDLADASAA